MAHDPAKRLRQLQRVLTIIELLVPLKDGATTGELAESLYEEFGKFCRRTVSRDLQTLQQLGLVEPRDRREPRGHWMKAAIGETSRWVWVGKTAGARAIAETAEQLAEESLSASA